jgi:hypothetical protein
MSRNIARMALILGEDTNMRNSPPSSPRRPIFPPNQKNISFHLKHLTILIVFMKN